MKKHPGGVQFKLVWFKKLSYNFFQAQNRVNYGYRWVFFTFHF
jgi:hypothetical protein